MDSDFSSIGSDRFKKMVKISMVSNSVVTAVEKNCNWFVKSSAYIHIALDFPPFDFTMRFIAALNEVLIKGWPLFYKYIFLVFNFERI